MGRYLVVFARPGDDGAARRLGITATRKIGGAVVRNRARRRVRELCRAQQDLLEGWAGDLVVNVRKGCAEAGWEELVEDLARCLSKVRRVPRAPVS